MKYYEFLPQHLVLQFEERYKKMPHRYKNDEKSLNVKGLEKLMLKANSYTNINDDVKKLHKSYYRFKTDSIISYLEEWDKYIVLLIWVTYSNAHTHKLIRVKFIDPITNDTYSYGIDNFRGIELFRNAEDVTYGSYYSNAYTLFYNYSQKNIDFNTYSILKKLERFNYIPLEKFEKYNLFKLLSATPEMLNHYEILLKSGATKLATDLMLHRDVLNKDCFKKIKQILSKNRTYNYYQKLINPPQVFNPISIRQHLPNNNLLEEDKLYQNDILMKNMKKIFIEYQDFIITNPTSLDDLKYESEKLNHCLGKSMILEYSSYIVKKKSTILFLRRIENPDEPFFTIELKNNTLVQCRSTNNSTDENITEIVKSFISNQNNLSLLQIGIN